MTRASTRDQTGRHAGARRRLAPPWLVLLLALACASIAGGQQADRRLTTPVRQSLHQIQTDWQAWQRAYYQDDRESAAAALAALRAAAGDLGFERLPELGAAAAAYAARSAASGNFPRAGWALEDARSLDPSRPEAHFAAASVAWRRGGYLSAAVATVRAHIALLRLEVTRTTLLHNVFLWLMLVVLAGGALMVIVEMAVRGGDLLDDLGRLLPALPAPLLLILGSVLFLWPLVLPFGVLWLLLYWIVLLLGYVSVSERVVLAGLLLAIGATPVLLQSEQRAMELAVSPPARLLTALENGQLYGRLFSDLEVLESLLPGNPAVIELEADLHRRLGQWELARVRYGLLLEEEPANAAALNNLGVYSLRKQDFGGATAYFTRATEAEPQLVEGFFNLNQALSREYFFGQSHEALAQAQQIDREQVDRWLEIGDAELAISIDGARARQGEIRRALTGRWRADLPASSWQRLRGEVSLSVTFGLLLVAVIIHVLRWRLGYATQGVGRRPGTDIWSRLRRALIPGWRAVREGHGVRAFLASASFVALISLPLTGGLRYRLPVDVEVGSWPLLALSGAGLVLLVLMRLGQELTAEKRQ